MRYQVMKVAEISLFVSSICWTSRAAADGRTASQVGGVLPGGGGRLGRRRRADLAQAVGERGGVRSEPSWGGRAGRAVGGREGGTWTPAARSANSVEGCQRAVPGWTRAGAIVPDARLCATHARGL